MPDMITIAGTVANQPVASGSTIRPFATVETNYNFFAGGAPPMFTAVITLTDDGNVTDADGLLSGMGLSKTGVGTYSDVVPDPYSSSLSNYLQALVFTPTAVPAGITRVTGFDLNVVAAGGYLATDDKTTTVDVIGPIAAPSPPLIADVAATQTVAPGNAISPFNAVTISDTNAAPLDSATITVNAGTLEGVGLILNGTNVYTVSATTPTALTSILDAISLAPSTMTAPNTIKLTVADGQQSATASTTIQEVAAPTPPPPASGGNFTIADETTGTQAFAAGTAYIGPVQGLANQIILLTPDNLNITSHVPNSFIHSGAGNDAIDVSSAGGNNILDGSTGSNYLTGGTGDDTFYLDDRSPTSDVFSTVVGFHSGDNVSIFGVDPTNFKIAMLDNQGAVSAKGLDFAFTEAGHPNANVVIAGFTVADLSNGKLTDTFGTTTSTPGLPGSTYLNIHGN